MFDILILDNEIERVFMEDTVDNKQFDNLLRSRNYIAQLLDLTTSPLSMCKCTECLRENCPGNYTNVSRIF